jgi:transmembrane sensor
MVEKNEKILIIIEKQISGTALPEELRELNIWLNQSEQNREEYTQFKKLLEDSYPALLQNVNTDAAWQKVSKRLTNLQQEKVSVAETKVIPIYSWKRFMAVAAVFVLAVVAVWLFTVKNEDNIITISATTANKQIQLPDGTIIFLRKASTVSYPESFTKSRKITLSGEALFDVFHDEKNKFIITTSNTVIEDIGTSFSVNNTTDKDQIVVISGKVKCVDVQTGKKTALLNSGQKAEYAANGLTVGNVTDSNFLSWKTGVLHFENATLLNVVEELSHYYRLKITCAPDDNITKLIVNLHFNNQPVEQVLDEIKLTTGLQLRKSQSEYIFYR